MDKLSSLGQESTFNSIVGCHLKVLMGNPLNSLSSTPTDNMSISPVVAALRCYGVHYIHRLLQGPFDGILSFSQGAALASLLCGLREENHGKNGHRRLHFGPLIHVLLKSLNKNLRLPFTNAGMAYSAYSGWTTESGSLGLDTRSAFETKLQAPMDWAAIHNKDAKCVCILATYLSGTGCAKLSRLLVNEMLNFQTYCN